MPRPLSATSALRERRVAEINTRYQAHVGAGYPVTLEGNAETLQVAREVDCASGWATCRG